MLVQDFGALQTIVVRDEAKRVQFQSIQAYALRGAGIIGTALVARMIAPPKYRGAATAIGAVLGLWVGAQVLLRFQPFNFTPPPA